MKITRLVSLFILSVVTVTGAFSQLPPESEVFVALKGKDSILFDVVFNTCDIDPLRDLIHDDFEFYHDQSGITETKDDFISSIENNICKLDYQPIRLLRNESLQVYPLKNNGTLYGAIQMGTHDFYASYDGVVGEVPTSSAEFTHLWVYDQGDWQLKRVLSYNHRSPK